MKKCAKIFMVLALGAIICLPGMAFATITSIDGLVDDWNQQFNESGVGTFNLMEAFMISGGSVWTGGFSNFSNGSWVAEIVGPSYAHAAGNATTNLNFNLSGTDVGPPNVFSFDFLAWNGSTLVEHVGATFNNGWHFSAPFVADANAYDRAPLPPSLLLLGTPLLGLIGLHWRRGKAGPEAG